MMNCFVYEFVLFSILLNLLLGEVSFGVWQVNFDKWEIKFMFRFKSSVMVLKYHYFCSYWLFV